MSPASLAPVADDMTLEDTRALVIGAPGAPISKRHPNRQSVLISGVLCGKRVFSLKLVSILLQIVLKMDQFDQFYPLDPSDPFNSPPLLLRNAPDTPDTPDSSHIPLKRSPF